ncbi:MAG: tetratricopeptide repeat protein [Gammaproteobacteria bacterium]
MTDQEVYIFELSQDSFNSSVIFNSHKLPVIVEFMQMWSEPCNMLSDALSDKAKEFAGQFIFARVDVDEQQELRRTYSVENVPTLKVFKDGEVVRTEEGLLNEQELLLLLKNCGIFHESDEMREQARDKHMAGETIEAINILTRAIQKDPKNTRVAMDMVQVLIDINEPDQASTLFDKLPEKDKSGAAGRSLAGQLTFRKLAANTAGKDILLQRIASDPDDYDAHFDLSICLVAEHDYKQAMDHLFAILQKDPEYKQGAAREMIISMINMLAPNEPVLAQEFRRRLGNVMA